MIDSRKEAFKKSICKSYYNAATNYAISNLKEKERREKGISEDSKIRMELHETIRKMLIDGKSKEEILSYLYNTYSTFLRKDAFSGYIDNQINKLKSNNNDLRDER